MEEGDIYKKAAKKVKAKKGFFYHLIAFACIIGMLYAIMYFENNKQFLPVIIVGLSWGIGLGIHYFSVFGTEHLEFLGINSNWEEEELEKEIERLKRKKEREELTDEEYEQLEDFDRLELRQIEQRRLDDQME